MTTDFVTDFASDNTSGVHPKILEAIGSVNKGHAQSYGMDPLSEKLQVAIKNHFGDGAVAYPVFNGTAANVLSLGTCLKSFEAVICSDVSHMQMDECAAPERWLGTKLLLATSSHGKISIDEVKKHLIRGGDQHYAQPKVLSLTQPTELGTCYTLSELKDFSQLCKRHNMFLHIDGARLANAAIFLGCDLKTLTQHADVVSLGGTKNGLMNVEAVVFLNSALGENFKFLRKQGLQLASKHRFLAIQLLTYLDTNLWRDIATHSHTLAKKLAALVKEIPQIEIISPVESNAIFAKVPKKLISPLKDKFFFYVWDEFDSIVRWMVSWDHTEQDIEAFAQAIREIL